MLHRSVKRLLKTPEKQFTAKVLSKNGNQYTVRTESGLNEIVFSSSPLKINSQVQVSGKEVKRSVPNKKVAREVLV